MGFPDELLMKTEWVAQSVSKWVFSFALFLFSDKKISISYSESLLDANVSVME